jgi:hypothetical protein
MRLPVLAALALIAAPARAGETVPIEPFGSIVRFAPHSPRVVEADHPWRGKLTVAPIIAMPERVGAFLNTFTRTKEMNAALARTIADAGLAAGSGNSATHRLTVTWVAFDAPFKISFSSRVSATLRYELMRVDTGEPVFRRDVTTAASASGGNAADRMRGVARAVLSANIAGAIWCLEESPFGRAPVDSVTAPQGSFSAPITVPVFYPR